MRSPRRGSRADARVRSRLSFEPRGAEAALDPPASLGSRCGAEVENRHALGWLLALDAALPAGASTLSRGRAARARGAARGLGARDRADRELSGPAPVGLSGARVSGRGPAASRALRADRDRVPASGARRGASLPRRIAPVFRVG